MLLHEIYCDIYMESSGLNSEKPDLVHIGKLHCRDVNSKNLR